MIQSNEYLLSLNVQRHVMLHVVEFTEPAVADVTLERPGARVDIPVWLDQLRLGRVNEYNIKQESYMWLFKSPGVGKVFVHSEHLWGFVWWNFLIFNVFTIYAR